MTKPPKTDSPTKPAKDGDRIAKVLSRAGVASRREAERMIELGQVAVNGKVITSPALNVTAKDRITVDGQPLAAAEPARLWLYYKPDGLVTSESDEKGRATVFEHLPPELPRVMSVGRLDLNSEGLLLLTNDGELKRRLELPSTGWMRKYRVRIKGNPTDPELEPLRKGIEVDGERFQPMLVILDRHQGANAWLTVGLREGKNREIRRAMTAIGLTVNRLIRISYGPFRLGDLEPGDVSEVRGKVLREQLGFDPATDELPEPRRPMQSSRKTIARPPRAAVDAAAAPLPSRRGPAKAAAAPRNAPATPTDEKPGPRSKLEAKAASKSGGKGWAAATKPTPRGAGTTRNAPAGAAKPAPRRPRGS